MCRPGYDQGAAAFGRRGNNLINANRVEWLYYSALMPSRTASGFSQAPKLLQQSKGEEAVYVRMEKTD